jgi:hypothetical protein
MNMGFWPLFRHIERRGIEMTSPVEMDYHGKGDGLRRDIAKKLGESNADAAQPDAEKAWTMSFLYRETSNGDVGTDGNVRILDTEPLTVIAIGYTGSYSSDNVDRYLETLKQWVTSQQVWEVAGEPRALFYNGPDVRNRDKWAEAQIPVRLKQPAEIPTTAAIATEPGVPSAAK